MDGQAWDPVVIRKTGPGSGGGGGGGGGGARAAGGGPVERRDNSSAHLRKLEEDTETFKHATVGVDLRIAIQQARLAKKLTQKDLAAACALKPTIINVRRRRCARARARVGACHWARAHFNPPFRPFPVSTDRSAQDYEAGRAVPDNALIAKFERVLGVRLPRPPKK